MRFHHTKALRFFLSSSSSSFYPYSFRSVSKKIWNIVESKCHISGEILFFSCQNNHILFGEYFFSFLMLFFIFCIFTLFPFFLCIFLIVFIFFTVSIYLLFLFFYCFHFLLFLFFLFHYFYFSFFLLFIFFPPCH